MFNVRNRGFKALNSLIKLLVKVLKSLLYTFILKLLKAFSIKLNKVFSGYY
jgi:hypothetical protein